MKPLPVLLVSAGVLSLGLSSRPAGAGEAGEFVPMFNGKDLSGWVNVNWRQGPFLSAMTKSSLRAIRPAT